MRPMKIKKRPFFPQATPEVTVPNRKSMRRGAHGQVGVDRDVETLGSTNPFLFEGAFVELRNRFVLRRLIVPRVLCTSVHGLNRPGSRLAYAVPLFTLLPLFCFPSFVL